MGGAYLAAQFSGRQPATVALDVGISAVRLITVLMVVFWCQELIAREIERKTVFFALAYPVRRADYLLGKYFGILGLTAVAILILSCLLIATVKISASGFLQSSPVDLGGGYWLTVALLFLDAATIAGFTVLISTISTTPLLPLALGIAFAMIARGLGTALSYLHDTQSGAADLANTLGPIVDFFRWIIPDLGRLDVRAAALYGQWPTADATVWPGAMCAAYIAVSMILAIHVFSRREFQ
jgi:ABC-type transport system involved in multi-copper enzyme maturation permease subunit